MKIKNSSSGGATIADRFKLEQPDVKPRAAGGGRTLTIASFYCGLVALALTGTLAYLAYQHWEIMMAR